MKLKEKLQTHLFNSLSKSSPANRVLMELKKSIWGIPVKCKHTSIFSLHRRGNRVLPLSKIISQSWRVLFQGWWENRWAEKKSTMHKLPFIQVRDDIVPQLAKQFKDPPTWLKLSIVFFQKYMYPPPSSLSPVHWFQHYCVSSFPQSLWEKEVMMSLWR